MADDVFTSLLNDAQTGAFEPVAPSGVDPIFSGLLDEAEREAKRASFLTAKKGVAANPDAYAEQMDIGKALGVPIDLVGRNLPQLKEFKGVQDLRQLMDRNPPLARFYQAGDNPAAIKVDELRHLDTLAWLYRAPVEAFQSGSRDVDLASLRFKQLMGMATGDEITRADAMSADREPRTFGADSWLGKGWVGVAQQLPIMGQTIMEGLAGGAAGAVTGGAIAGIAGQLGPQIALPEEILTVPGGAAVGFRYGSIAGQWQSSLKLEAGLAYDEFRSLRDSDGKPMDDDVARAAAIVSGAASAFLETYSFRKLASIVPGLDRATGALSRDAVREALARPTVRAALKTFAANTLKSGATEVTTEVAQEAIQLFAGEAAKLYANQAGGDVAYRINDPGGDGDGETVRLADGQEWGAQNMYRVVGEGGERMVGAALLERVLVDGGGQFEMLSGADVATRLADTFERTLQTMTIMGPALSSTRLGQDVYRSRQAARDMAVIEAINAHAEGNELNARLPDKAKEAIRSLTEGGPIQHVYIAPEAFSTYFQTSEEASQFAAAVGLTEEYNEAQRLGRDMEVPIADYYVGIAGTEIGEAIKPFVRFSPDNMTGKEAEEFNAAWDDAQQSLRAEYEAGIAEDRQAMAGEELIFEDVKNKAMNAGIVPDQAAQYAKLYSAFFRTMAQRTGQDAGELYARYGFDVKRALPSDTEMKAVDNLELALAVVRAGKIDPLRKRVAKARGPSLLEQIIARGGILDSGGELAGMDVPARAIRREPKTIDSSLWTGAEPQADFNEFSPDDVARQMGEEGFFPDIEGRPTPRDLLDAIAEEVGGRPRYSPQYDRSADPQVEQAAGLVQFADMLDQLGIDPATMDNDAIRAAIDEAANRDPESAAMFQVPIAQAKRINIETDLPATEKFREAVAGTAGAEITDDGLVIDLVRFQKPEQGGGIAVRTGVFYLPAGSKDAKHYKATRRNEGTRHNSETYGGTDEVRGKTLLKRPLFIKGSTGGKAPEAAYISLHGKKAFDNLEREIFSAVNATALRKDGLYEENIMNLLERHGADPDMVYDIIHYSAKGNQLRYALQENIVAHAVRAAGYDSVVGYGEGRGDRGAFISEVFDVREIDYPMDGEREASLHPQFQREYFQRLPELTPAVRSNGKIYKSVGDHLSAIGQITDPKERTAAMLDGDNRGYVDHRGRFLDRFRAQEYALENDLIRDDAPSWARKSPELISEHLKKPGREYLQQEGQATQADVEALETEIRERHDLRSLHLFLTKAGDLKLNMIAVERDKQGKGVGSAVMRDITDFADSHGLRMTLQTGARDDGFGTTSAGRLKSFYKRFGFVENKGRNKDFAVSDNMIREPARELFQQEGQDQSPKATKRGSIQIAPGRTVINMFDQADLSTFLHESGHFFLEVFRDLANSEGVPEALLQDWSTTREYLGIGEGGEITTEAHEKFARSFEAYLFEGKSPSQDVAGVMARFRSWLVFVYQTVKRLNAPISDNMRRVMDRLIATDEEITAARMSSDFQPAFASAKEAGMSEAQWKDYVATAQRAVDAARRDMDQRMMSEIARETTKEWREAKRALRQQVAAEYENVPVYKVMRYLRTGEGLPGDRLYLDKGGIVALMGDGALLRLPRSVPPLYREKGGVHPDVLAEMFGMKSGHEMLTLMMSVQPFGRAVNDEVALRMRKQYGDLMGDAVARARVAQEAIATDETGELLNAEIGVLVRKGLATSQVNKQDARRLARELVRGKTIREAIRIKLYQNANLKASQEAEKAIRKGDWSAALSAKKRQLLNHYMAMEAREAERDTEKAVAYLNKFTGRKRPKGVWPEHLDRIEGLLERFDLRKSVTLKAEQRRSSLSAWIAEQEAMGELVVLPDVMRDDAFRKPYRQMTVDDLMAVRDAVKNIEHIGRRWAAVYGSIEAREFNAKRDEIVASVAKSQPLRKEQKERNPTRFQSLLAQGRSLEAGMLKLESVFDWMDAKDINGPLRRLVWQPIADAETRENDMRVKVVGEFQRIMGRLDKARLNERISIPGLRETYLRSEIMAVALNMGNESNMDKMKRGEGWSDTILDRVVSHLNADEWQAVQGIWDTINSLWPDIAALQRRLTGVEPPKVEARRVMTPFGELKGGYYPLMYDPRRSTDVGDRDAAAADRLFENTYLRPETRHGFTKERQQAYTRPLLFDLNGAARHLTAVIHDVTHREAILGAYKLLTNPNVRGEISNRYSPELWQQMVPWLQSIAHDAYKNDGLSAVENMFRSIRSRATIMGMGFRISTMLSQIAGYSSSLEMVPVKAMAGAVKDFTMSPRQMWQEVNAKSGEMRYRSSNLDRDINEQLKQLTGKEGLADRARRFAFYGIGFMDRVVTVPTWTAAYRDHLQRMPGDEEGAIAHADKVVRLTAGAGGPKDLAAITRKNELTKLITTFYSYFSGYYNRQRTWFRDVSRKIRTGKGDSFASLLARQVFMTVGPAILAELLVGRGPDDDESYAAWAAKKIAFYPFAAVPIVRDAAGVFDDGFGYAFTPSSRVIDELLIQPFKIFGDIVDGEFDPRKAVKQTLETTGYALMLPLGQPATTVDNVWKALEKDDFQLRDLVLTRPKD